MSAAAIASGPVPTVTVWLAVNPPLPLPSRMLTLLPVWLARARSIGATGGVAPAAWAAAIGDTPGAIGLRFAFPCEAFFTLFFFDRPCDLRFCDTFAPCVEAPENRSHNQAGLPAC